MRGSSLWSLLVGGCLVAGLGCGPDRSSDTKPTYPSNSQALSTPGAIFTTTPDGSIVNENVHYKTKLEVYLDGGPGPNAPIGAAGLPDGEYYFQVTDPSGKVLLSEDPAKCRRIRVQGGVIVELVAPANDEYLVEGKKGPVTMHCHAQDDQEGTAGASGLHDTNTDTDHGDQGAIVVQLMPFFDTPNNGGVYKAWVVTVDQYENVNGGDADLVPVPVEVKNKQVGYEADPGFGPSRNNIKTDNFKVKLGKPCPMSLIVRKFHDADVDGVMDPGEEEITGWPVQIIDPLGVSNTLHTVAEVLPAPDGIWTVIEATEGTIPTVSILDNQTLTSFPNASPQVDVPVAGTCGEYHEVIFGNACIGHVTACKYYDKDRDGEQDLDEVSVEGWQMHLLGTDVTGAAVDEVGFTGADGCVSFPVLAGSYTVTEMMPLTGGWDSMMGDTVPVVVTSNLDGAQITCTADQTASFGNYCTGTADFGTKGYWHNKNGLNEMTQADIDYVNTLLPYSNPSSYFDACDEGFDGWCDEFLTKVAAVTGDWAEIIAGEGTAKAEVSHFLVDTNATGDPREQLAQQLLAFIFNAIHRLGGVGGVFKLPDGNYVMASVLIANAIDVWNTGTAAEQNDMASLLDALNNSDALPFVHGSPCGVSYP